MEISKAHTFISQFVRQGSYLGLDRMRALMRLLGDPQERLRCVHIAGTNGKGSTAAMLDAVLRAAGYKTGLYTSPAILSFNERIRIGGQPIDDDSLFALATDAEEAAKQLPSLGFELPSEFEFVTALGFLWFARQACEIVILEVGMGGRLDATNIIPCPEAAVLVALGMDHTAELGDTLAKIAGEKAAILKGSPCVSYGHAPEADEVIRRVCTATGSPLTVPDFDAILPHAQGLDGQTFSYKTHTNLTLSLLGSHQLRNAAVVLETLDVLRGRGWRIPEEAIRYGLSHTVWHARLEVLSADPVILLDGAHNPHGVRALTEALPVLAPRWIFLTGILADKAHGEMLPLIAPLAREVITVTPPSPRAMTGEALCAEAERLGLSAVFGGTLTQAVALARQRAAETGLPLCIFGSLYMTGDILRLFGREAF